MMRLFLVLALGLLPCSLCHAVSMLQNPAGPDMEQLIRQSHFIFRGKVEKLQASNLKILPATERTAVVRVQQELYAPKTLNDFTGQLITVQLVESGVLKYRQEAIFFTNGWLYGESIAVTEVAHLPPEVSPEELRKQIADVHGKMENEKLQARISRAALIVVGKVKASRPLDRERKTALGSEHDPDWWQAEIEVESVEKGQLPGREVVVLFPKSVDEMWADSPKFKEGEEGVWILQVNQQERGFPVMRVPGLTALDPLDFQLKSELDRIRRLAKFNQ
jgi:hypothetical protein